MKLLKKIAFGTMTSALCFFSASNLKADRVDIELQGGYSGVKTDIFGDKAPKYKDKDGKDQGTGPGGSAFTHGFVLGGALGYTYDFNEMVGAGLKIGGFWTQQSGKHMAMKGTNETEAKKASYGVLSMFVGPEINVYPMSESSLILSFFGGARLNFMGKYKAGWDQTGLDEKNDPRHAKRVQSDTAKLKKLLQIDAGLGLKYDLSTVADFPVVFGVKFCWTFMNLFNTELPKEGKDAKYFYGFELKEADKNAENGDGGFKPKGTDIINFNVSATVGMNVLYFFE